MPNNSGPLWPTIQGLCAQQFRASVPKYVASVPIHTLYIFAYSQVNALNPLAPGLCAQVDKMGTNKPSLRASMPKYVASVPIHIPCTFLSYCVASYLVN